MIFLGIYKPQTFLQRVIGKPRHHQVQLQVLVYLPMIQGPGSGVQLRYE